MAINIVCSLARRNLIPINPASKSILSTSILCCNSFLKNIATPVDPLVVCRREVGLNADSQRKPSTRGSPLFGLWCVSTKKRMSDISRISSNRSGCVHSEPLQFHMVILILLFSHMGRAPSINGMTIYYYSPISVKCMVPLLTSLKNSWHTYFAMLDFHLCEVFIKVYGVPTQSPKNWSFTKKGYSSFYIFKLKDQGSLSSGVTSNSLDFY